MRVKVDDVIKRAESRVDKDNTDLEYYVGGEHIDGGEFSITKRGIIKGSTIGPMFYFGFKQGDFLLTSRSPDLKKAGRVDFPGICSEKTFVLATKDDSVLLQDYLPLVFQNNRYWAYVDKNKSGSVNYFMNWSKIKEYEFDLPPLEEQKRLADILWAAEELKQKIENSIRHLKILKRSCLNASIDSFSDSIITYKISEAMDIIKNNSYPREMLATSGIVKNIHYGDIHTHFAEFLDASDSRIPYLNDSIDISKINDSTLCENGDIILADASEDYNGIGKAIELINIDSEKIVSGLHTIHLRPKKNLFTTGYLTYIMESAFVHSQFIEIAVGSKVYAITKNDIKSIKIPTLPINAQSALVKTLMKIDLVISSLQEYKMNVCELEKTFITKIYNLSDNF